MKTNNPNRANRLAVWLSLALALLGVRAQALDVIDPTGTNYTGISDSSEYSSSYTAAFLFDDNVTGIPLGTILSGDGEYASAGQATNYVAFQLDTLYTNVGSIFYAQRAGGNPTEDKINFISIWASTNTPFSASDPGTPPDATVAVTNLTGAQWTEYLLTNTISGQYFLVELAQFTLAGNPGGHELRLGAALGLPPTIGAISNKIVYVGGTARFTAIVGGSQPLTYSWLQGTTPLTNDARISGANTSTLVVSDVSSGDGGDYTLAVSNPFGTGNGSANLAVINAPTNAVEAAVIADQPLAFWQLNESTNTMPAFDYVGTFNGTYGPDSIVGVAGPQPPAFPGFSSTNTCVQTTALDLLSPVTVPAMNISTNDSVTILAWIYPDDSSGPQQPYTGIVFCRGAGTASGLICDAGGTNLGYQWDGSRFFFESGLELATNQWNMVALVYTSNFTTLYCGTNNGVVLSAVDDVPQGGQTFAAPMEIGIDTDVGESTRTFNGLIDDVAFFNRALSSDEINAIYQAGTGLAGPLQILGQSETNVAVFQGESTTMIVQVAGLSTGQWYVQNTPIIGATNDSYTISSATVSNSGNYYLVVSNQVNGSITSAVFSVTVPNYLVAPIGPTGTNYTNVSDSSEYSSAYAGTNMFDDDMTGIPLLTHLTGPDWAAVGTAPEFMAFQVDQIYSVVAIFYAQRSGANLALDKITQMSIWGSTNAPFTASDPGTPPDAVIPITNPGGAIWDSYPLPTTIIGQYFLIEIEQNPNAGGNIGGNQFRLGEAVVPVPLTYSVSPSGLTLNWPNGAVLQQAANLNGPWTTATGVISGQPIPMTATQQFYRILY
jgi:Concanavalin A-like lectin/glucanases superfamily/Immunoglobulin I-set domain